MSALCGFTEKSEHVRHKPAIPLGPPSAESAACEWLPYASGSGRFPCPGGLFLVPCAYAHIRDWELAFV
jgi:hypothetical protein